MNCLASVPGSKFFIARPAISWPGGAYCIHCLWFFSEGLPGTGWESDATESCHCQLLMLGPSQAFTGSIGHFGELGGGVCKFQRQWLVGFGA